MTVINLDDQIVASTYDKAARTCSYTYEHTDGSRYTVTVPLADLEKVGPMPQAKMARRQHLAQRVLTHIQSNPPDPEPDERSPDRAVEAQAAAKA